MHINYSNATPGMIQEGISRLGQVLTASISRFHLRDRIRDSQLLPKINVSNLYITG